MPKEIIGQKLTKKDVEAFLRKVEDSREYEDPGCREKIDKILDQIKVAIYFSGLDNKVNLSVMVEFMDNLATAIQEASRRPFKEYLLKTDLTVEQRLGLNLMAMGYGESVATAKEIDPGVETRPLTQVLDEIIKFSPEKLKAVAEFNRPTLLVVPKNHFSEKREAMDGNRKYPDQEEMFVYPGSNTPYQIINSDSKVRISIVDGAAKMPHIQGIAPDSRFDKRKRLFKKHYADKKVGMRLIDIHEYAVLIQHSLRDFKRTGSSDTSKIMDFYRSTKDTITCLDDDNLTSSPYVAYGYFRSDYRKVIFNAEVPDFTNADLRGRPSMPVMEY